MIDSASGNKIKENKYKILRMSLLLGTGDDREETINNFEDAARDIDAMNDEVYLKELEDKFYDTLTLEEEEKKLASLVDYIGGRAQQRVSLINDFANVTGYELSNLPPIKYYDRLDEYKDRLNYIREYLDNTSKINTLSKEVEDLEVSLEKTYSNKEKAEERNSSDEKELLNKFKNIINRNAGLKDIDVDNIDNVLADVSLRASDSKKSLDIFEKSFSTLENAGISYDEEQEYSSYVSDARDIYYKNKEQEYLLTIYKLLIGSESEYSKIIYKRNAINDILYERINLRKELGIKDSDVLEDIYDLLDRQYKNIERQKVDIDNIDILSKEINDKREMIKELELDNQKVEILSLLKEFCIIDTYDDVNESSNVDLGNISVDDASIGIVDENVSDSISESVGGSNIFDDNNSNTDSNAVNNDDVKDSQVVDVKDISNVDLEAIISKANTVMKRVGKMLGVNVEEDEKIVSVENNDSDESKGVTDNSVGLENKDISNNSVVDNSVKEDSGVDRVIPVDANNLFFNGGVDSSGSNEESNDAFWSSSSFDAGGLSSLPDLPEAKNTDSNNFFANNEIPELKFDFGNNDSEVQ